MKRPFFDQARQALEQSLSAPQRYGTAFHILPPYPDVSVMPAEHFESGHNLEHSDFTDTHYTYFKEQALSNPYLIWHWAHSDILPVQTVIIHEGEHKKIRLTYEKKSSVSDVLWIIVEKNASLDLEDIVTNTALAFRHMHLVQHEGSRVRLWHVRGNNTFSYDSLRVTLLERNAEVQVVHLASGSLPTQTDMGVRVEHVGQNTKSQMQVRHTGYAQQTFIYRGVIDIAKGASGSQGYQQGRSLLLSSQAKSDIVPELHIKTNDVQCSHGVTTTHLDDRALFYLRSRGIAQEKARQLAIRGFFHQNLALSEPLAHTIDTLVSS